MSTQRALVVDDNADIRESLGVLLELLGITTVTEASGANALIRVAHAHSTGMEFDVAFVDVSMPEMSGYEFAQAHRSTYPSTRTILVAMTGWASPRDCERALQSGFDLHMGKPLEMNRLRDLLAKLPPQPQPR